MNDSAKTNGLTLEQLDLGTLADRLGITMVALSASEARGTMPVEGNTQPYGLLHGGASAALGETLGSFAAGVHALATGKAAVGIEIAMTHHRSATEGIVTGVATARHLGSRLAAYELTVRTDDGTLLASGHLTCMLIEQPPGAAQLPVRP